MIFNYLTQDDLQLILFVFRRLKIQGNPAKINNF